MVRTTGLGVGIVCNRNALTFKAHGLTCDNLTALAGFHRAVDFDQPIRDRDFRLRARKTSLQPRQIAQLNVRVFA